MKIKFTILTTFLIGCDNDNPSNNIDMQVQNLDVSMSIREASNLGFN